MTNENKLKAQITALGGYVPENILTNADLETMVATSDEWITTRTGIKERRILAKTLATSDMASLAIKDLLENYNVNPEGIDCLILATATPDSLLAPTASVVCKKAGLKNAWAFDMNAACSGFLYALSMGAALIESHRYKNVLVVGADKMSSIVNYEDRNSCILFGDGAGVVLLNGNAEGNGVHQSIFKTDGDGAQYLSVPAGGSLYPSSYNTVAEKKHYIHQDGKSVFKEAVKNMGMTCKEILEKASLSSEAVDWVVPHQANLRIIQAVSKETGIDIAKFKINIHRYGNTTSATIPLCLWDFKNDFKRGDNIILTAFGAGFTWGSTYLKW